MNQVKIIDLSEVRKIFLYHERKMKAFHALLNFLKDRPDMCYDSDKSDKDPKAGSKEWQKEYYRKNREKILEKQKVYNRKNREKMINNSKEYYRENIEEIKKKKKKYYQENKEKIMQKRKIRRNQGVYFE